MRERKYQDHLKYIMSLSGSQVVGEGVKDMQLGINFTKNPAYRLQSSESLGNQSTSITISQYIFIIISQYIFIIIIENKKTIANLNSMIEELNSQKNNVENEATQLREINASLIDKLKTSSINQEQYNEENLKIDPQFME